MEVQEIQEDAMPVDPKSLEEAKRLFARLQRPVRLVFFTQPFACAACREQKALLEALAGLSDKVTLEVHQFAEDAEAVRTYGIERVPATAVVGERDYGIRFYGITAGYEFPSLLEAILLVSTGEVSLDPAIQSLVQRIDVPVHLEILVTLTCPYCPKMVQLAHQLAYLNDHIRADMIDVAEFPELAVRYGVSGVPLTVVNERPAFEGALPPLDAVMEILKRVKPSEYERLEAAIREAAGERRVRWAKTDKLYDVIIVGAGPAAMSAAIYAVRKNLEVALLGDEVGGQMVNTASIENWLGIPEISGFDLAMAFRRHVERYPIAERLHVQVTKVSREGGGFAVETSDGSRYRAKTVIYCAGKRYRTLGVPGESRFLGHGIAFCATCDAPLYRDKRVAVVGGGNSAFTAARDLLPFAREIHIINIKDTFQADPILIEEVTRSDKVVLHPAMEVKAFLGKERLEGVRLQSVDGRERMDLLVEGVFLEIGLIPNSQPVEGLLPLNEHKEIPVARDQSTAVEGFFAAGDVTDEPYKQLIVAAGAGAKAALRAYDYFMEKKR
ncbi:MAG: hypothetical protein D6819_09950 [Gammaproteobacteria bacterium]|nr:MAG: hypothetical protein D6819_09950 [Gammaproteobacteria bacterium]